MDNDLALQDGVASNNAINPPENQVKMIPQTEMNAVVKREKEAAAHIARQEAEREYLKKLEAIQQQQTQHTNTVSRDVDLNAIYQQLQEKFNADMQQRQLEAEMQSVVNNYTSKMQGGKQSYQDFEDITKDFEPDKFPQLVYLVSGLDNAADIIYDLSRNPIKLAGLNNLALQSPKLAQAELQKLSRSISDNQQARNNNVSVNAPLDRLQSSRVNSGNGKMSISDLRSQPWLRG